jgi:hypothetical protein
MTAVIFVGPTCPRDACERILPADIRGPAARGDVYRAALQDPSSIGLVDGYFETVPAVLHKEILFALSRGIPVFGCSSMGALRAAELAEFGMQGVGEIFDAYRRGEIEDDDEVAVSHGPEELGYPQISEALVNIRATLKRAVAEHVLSDATAQSLLTRAKGTFYKLRAYSSLLPDVAGITPKGELDGFKAWLPTGKIDQKHRDAISMFNAMKSRDENQSRDAASFRFNRTRAWEALEHEVSPSGQARR